MAQHKHAALIKAWADGAEIQQEIFGGTWIDHPDPSWNPGIRYRIKPQIEKRRYRVALCQARDGYWYTTSVDNEAMADGVQRAANFHSWLTDWVEYEVEVQP